MDFQEYLIDKGWKRYYIDYSLRDSPKVYSNNKWLSSYGPTEYLFEHFHHPELILCWGMFIYKKPPVFYLNSINIIHDDKHRLDQDLWFDIMKMLDFDTIYNLILTKGTVEIKNDKINIL